MALASGALGSETALVEGFRSRILSYGLRHLGSRTAAEDLAQEVLMITLQALRAGRVEDPDRLDRFILGVCRNTVASWRRAEYRREQATNRLDPVAEVRGPAVESLRVSECLHALAERARTVLVLTYIEERTAEDIAMLLELSVANVRVIRHRALVQVRECIELRGVTP